jgi:dienelactone hydrolase
MHKSMSLGMAALMVALLALAACDSQAGPVVGTTAPPASIPPPAQKTPYPAGTEPTPLPTMAPDNLYPCPGCRPTISVVPGIRDEVIDVSGVQLRGKLYTPGNTPAPAVLLLHQNGGSINDFATLAPALQAGGFVVLVVDLRGHGATGGQVDWAATANNDVPKLVTWLAGQETVNAAYIGVLGSSVGANLALGAAAQLEQIKAAVLLSPSLDYSGVQTEPYAGIYAGPLMIVSSSEDTDAATGAARIAELHSGDENVVALNGAGHGVAMLAAQSDLTQQIVDWLKLKLQ